MALAVVLGTGIAPAPLLASASAPQSPAEGPVAAPQEALVLAPQAISLSLQAPANHSPLFRVHEPALKYSHLVQLCLQRPAVCVLHASLQLTRV